jgi:hypothetical protein
VAHQDQDIVEFKTANKQRFPVAVGVSFEVDLARLWEQDDSVPVSKRHDKT